MARGVWGFTRVESILMQTAVVIAVFFRVSVLRLSLVTGLEVVLYVVGQVSNGDTEPEDGGTLYI